MPDMHGNCVICRNCFFIPDIFINLIDGKYPALILYEKKQNIIFNWRKPQGFAIHLNFFLIVIHRQPAGCINMLTFTGNRCTQLGISSKLGTNPGNQL